MFGLLKNKISSFISRLSGKKEPDSSKQEDGKSGGKAEAQKLSEAEGQIPQQPLAPLMPPSSAGNAGASPANQPSPQAQESPQQPSASKPFPAAIQKEKGAPAQSQIHAKQKLAQESLPASEQKPSKDAKKDGKKAAIGAVGDEEKDFSRLEKKAQAETRSLSPKIGIGTAIKSFFSSEITISEAEISDLLDELELSLLEADVAYEVSEQVVSQLRSKLVGMKVPKGQIAQRTREAVADVLASVMESDRKFDFLAKVKSMNKPVKILFVGPNGAGKTTTMAKIAKMLLDAGLSVAFAAADTFRAAAIEQTEEHASRLGIKAIKSRYGADPASVAFDAINYARASKVDVVLIDSAGRQDTNTNLLSELSKINRVAKPDLKIYVGESIGGNAVIDQIKAFDAAIGMDGAILTKADCDAKGGTALSIAKATGIPVLFLGVGQGYSDLVPFDARKIANEIMN
ncbi:MAG: signal recognition particle-docking protein FtsY [Candidatus Micrarchaeota archaeon]|nr:signal recognition particle-docking protein FtsY [Candidatus Micrarchaeota archaeon]